MHSLRLTDHTMLGALTCINSPPSLPHSLHLFTNPFRIHYPQPHKKNNIAEAPHTYMGSYSQHQFTWKKKILRSREWATQLRSNTPVSSHHFCKTSHNSGNNYSWQKLHGCAIGASPTFSRVLPLIDRPFHIPFSFSFFSYNEIHVDLNRLVNFGSKSWGEHRIH